MYTYFDNKLTHMKENDANKITLMLIYSICRAVLPTMCVFLTSALLHESSFGPSSHTFTLDHFTFFTLQGVGVVVESLLYHYVLPGVMKSERYYTLRCVATNTFLMLTSPYFMLPILKLRWIQKLN